MQAEGTTQQARDWHAPPVPPSNRTGPRAQQTRVKTRTSAAPSRSRLKGCGVLTLRAREWLRGGARRPLSIHCSTEQRRPKGRRRTKFYPPGHTLGAGFTTLSKEEKRKRKGKKRTDPGKGGCPHQGVSCLAAKGGKEDTMARDVLSTRQHLSSSRGAAADGPEPSGVFAAIDQTMTSRARKAPTATLFTNSPTSTVL